ncbi:MAG: hypothetical protein R3324_03700, partial [Halobacteriales archaeon]|nr:hypothetical protein [Halobacteriales archaeon]
LMERAGEEWDRSGLLNPAASSGGGGETDAERQARRISEAIERLQAKMDDARTREGRWYAASRDRWQGLAEQYENTSDRGRAAIDRLYGKVEEAPPAPNLNTATWEAQAAAAERDWKGVIAAVESAPAQPKIDVPEWTRDIQALRERWADFQSWWIRNRDMLTHLEGFIQEHIDLTASLHLSTTLDLDVTVRKNGVVIIDDPDNTLTGGDVTAILRPGQNIGLARGGRFSGRGPFMVGEDGPELLFPSGPMSGTVVRNDLTQKALAGTMGGTTNVSVNVNVAWPIDPIEARRVAETIRREILDLDSEV